MGDLNTIYDREAAQRALAHIAGLSVAAKAMVLRELQRLASHDKAPGRGAPIIIPLKEAAYFKLCLRFRRAYVKTKRLIETPRASLMIVAAHLNIDTDDGRTLERLIQIAGISDRGTSRSGDTIVNKAATKMERELSPEARAQLSQQIASLQPYKRR
jgi:hypothetical protein